MKKWTVVVSLMSASVLAACSNGGDEGTNGASEAADGEPRQLLIWANDDDEEHVAALAAGFTEETGIEVEVVPFAMDEQEQSISLDGPSGRGPDLFYQPGVGNLALTGLVQPMEVDEEILAQYSEGSTEALSYQGELYGLPAVVETLAMYYNQDVIPEAPETMEELEAIAADMTDPSNDQFGFLYPATDFYFSFPFMAGYGAYIFAEEEGVYDQTDVGLANDGAIQAGEMFQRWYENGYLMVGVNNDIAQGLFTDGNVAAIINGPWALRELEESLGDSLATAPLPQLDNGEYPRTFLGTKGWMLSEYSDYPEEATQLAIHLTSEESLAEFYRATGEMPANSALLESEEFQNDPLLTGFATQLERAEPFIPLPALSAVWDPMADALEFISTGENVEEALEESVEMIETDISQFYTE
ncbi:extracellular solute-binding protein [Paenalkalicoccus suaedae]|nr:extracellular solute-binding protein [Paenalkalicoccus suaedae]